MLHKTTKTLRLKIAALALASMWTGVTTSAQTTLATYKFLSAGWATFGLPLPQGVARQGIQITGLTTQSDVKSRWPDGSIKFAVVSAQVTNAGSYAIVGGASTNNTCVPSTWPTAVVSMTIASTSPSGSPGAVYTATLPSFTAADSWLAGPLVCESRVRVVPTNGSAAHPFLRVVFDVRSFNDGTSRVDVIGENTLVQNASTDRVDYALTIDVNGSRVYQRQNLAASGTLVSPDSNNVTTSAAHGLANGDIVQLTSGPNVGELRLVSAITGTNTFQVSWPWPVAQTSGVTWQRLAVVHWAGTRWRKTFNVGAHQEAQLEPDFAPFYSSKAMPQYLPSIVTTTTWPAPRAYEPMETGAVLIPGNSAGGRAEIGPYPLWQAQYLVNPSQALRATVLNEGNAAGAYPIHWSDSDANPLIAITDHPQWLHGFASRVPSGCQNPCYQRGAGVNLDGTVDHFQMNNYHVGSLGHLPFLLTGDRYYSEESKFWANWGVLETYTDGTLNPGPGSRGGSVGYLGVNLNATRGFAWCLRNVADTAFWAPDNDVYKSYFSTIVTNNLSTLDTWAQGYSPTSFGQLFFDQWTPFNWPTGAYPGRVMSFPWADAYLTWALDRAIGDYGFPGGTWTRQRLAQNAIDLYTTGANYQRAPYFLFVGVRTAPGVPISYYPSLAAALSAEDAAATSEYGGRCNVWHGQNGNLPCQLAYSGNFGPDIRLAYIVAQRLGIARATEAIQWIEPLSGINSRGQFALCGGGTGCGGPAPAKSVVIKD